MKIFGREPVYILAFIAVGLKLASAYGLDSNAGLVDRVLERQQLTVERVLDLADRGHEPWASWVRSGDLETLRLRTRWTREHRHLVE